MKIIKSGLILFVALFMFGCGKDKEKPVINADDITVSVNEDYDFLKDVIVTDNSSKEVTVNHNGDTAVDLSELGEYTLTITAEDKAGNIKTVTIKVTVVDNTGPVIEASDIIVDEDTACDFLQGVTGTDNYDNEVTVTHDAETAVDLTTPGVYTLTYTATDEAGNTESKPVQVTVNDVTSPVIDVSDFNVDEDNYHDFLLEASVTDNYDSNVTLTHDGDTSVDLTTPGTYQLTYTATDTAGNIATKTVNVHVDMVTFIVTPTEVNEDLFNFSEFDIYEMFVLGDSSVGFTSYEYYDEVFKIFNDDGISKFQSVNSYGYLLTQIDEVYVVFLERGCYYYLLGVDENGQLLWQEEIDELVVNGDKFITVNGEIYYTYYDGYEDTYILRSVNKEGKLTDIYEVEDYYYDIYVQSDGNFIYIHSDDNGNKIVTKLSNDGVVMWEYVLNDVSYFHNQPIVSDSGVIIKYFSIEGKYNIIKLDNNGTLQYNEIYQNLYEQYYNEIIYKAYDVAEGKYSLLFIDDNLNITEYQYPSMYYIRGDDIEYGYEDDIIYVRHTEIDDEENQIFFIDVYSLDGDLLYSHQSDINLFNFTYVKNNVFVYDDMNLDNNYIILSNEGNTYQFGPYYEIDDYYVINNTIIINYFSSDGTSYYASYDFNGNLIAAKQIDNDNIYIDKNNIFIVDYDFENDTFTFSKLDNNFDLVWTKSFETPVEPIFTYENGDIFFIYEAEDGLYGFIVNASGETICEARILGFSTSYMEECFTVYVIDDEGVINKVQLPYETMEMYD